MKSIIYKNQASRVRRPDLLEGYANGHGHVHRLRASLPQSVTLSRSLRPVQFQGEYIAELLSALILISGQQPRVSYASKGVARLGIRQGAVSGAWVTLRGSRMEGFLARLVSDVQSRRPAAGEHNNIVAAQLDRRGNLRRVLPSGRVFPELEAAYQKYPRRSSLTIEVSRRFATSSGEAAWLLLGSRGRARSSQVTSI